MYSAAEIMMETYKLKTTKLFLTLLLLDPSAEEFPNPGALHDPMRGRFIWLPTVISAVCISDV